MKKIILYLLFMYSLVEAQVISLSSLQSSFDQVLAQHQKIVVKFWMPGCGPCDRMKSIIEELSNQFPDILFVEVNIKDYRGLVNRFSIRSVPVILYFRDGATVGRHNGSTNLATIKQEITSYLLF